MKGTLAKALLIGLLAGSAGCTGIKEDLGMVKQPPDEFRVSPRAPLSLPPEYSLRPPRAGETRPQEGTPQQQARRSVFRLADEQQPQTNGEATESWRSPGERAFLAAVGMERVNPEIRRIVEEEADRRNAEEKSFLDYIIFWREPLPPGVVVDAPAEAERLKENAALGKSATEGRTPTIKRRERAILEGIF